MPAQRAMARPARKPRGGKIIASLVVYISIRKAKASQKPATSRKISNKRSQKRKALSRKERKKREEMAKRRKTKRRTERTPGAPRGVKKRQRRQQRKRVKFTTATQPLRAFFLFVVQHRPALQKSNPHWTVVQTVKKLGKL